MKLIKYTFLLLSIGIVYSYFITYGNYDFFFSGNLNYAFDYLGNSFLRLKCDLPKEKIIWELFESNGKSYVYFGPFPALLRIILNFVFPSMFGKWAITMTTLATALCFLAFHQIISFNLRKNNYLKDSTKQSFLFILIIAFTFASPVFFLDLSVSIYHESILWGLCWSLWSIYFINLIENAEIRNRSMLALSITASLCLLSKITFALPIFIITFVLLIKYFKSFNSKSLVKIFLSFAIFLSFQGWYNNERFGSYFCFIDSSKYRSETERELIKNTINSVPTFNIQRIPIALKHYFAFRLDSFKPPFIKFKYPIIDKKLYWHSEHSLPFTMCTFWLFFITLEVLLFHRYFIDSKLTWIFLCAFLVEYFIILSYKFISYRYATEFIPLLVYILSLYLQKTKIKNLLFFKTITIISVVLTVLTNLYFICINNYSAPPDVLGKYKVIFSAIFR